MQVLITGGGGFVGRHFAKRLLDDWHDVVIVDDLSTGLKFEDWPFKSENFPVWFTRDCREFFKTYAASGFDLIIHCAAVVGGRLKIEGDPLAVATDLAIDSDFFRWCVADRKYLPKKVIYFSSSAAYPAVMQRRENWCTLAEPESMVDSSYAFFGMPDQTYGWSKLTGELLAQYAVKTYGLDVITYRPFSGYGEDQDETYPFPAIIRRVVNREDPIVIWGSGEQLRDFIHIDDVVEAVLRSAMGLADEYGQVHALQPGEVLNLGSGVGTRFRTIAEMACGTDKHFPDIVNDPTKPEGVFARVADVTKMRQFYQPKVSLFEGIRRSLDHVSGRQVLARRSAAKAG